MRIFKVKEDFLESVKVAIENAALLLDPENRQDQDALKQLCEIHYRLYLIRMLEQLGEYGNDD